MKRESNAQGRGWNVFYAPGSSGNTGHLWDYHEIQRYDCPDDGLLPAFDGDAEAVKYVIGLAKKGDEQAIAALWDCDQDPLIHEILWGVR